MKAEYLKPAIDDYVTALELFGNKEHISSVAYLAMARAYEKLGQFCDAESSVETWVTLNPANNSSRTQANLDSASLRNWRWPVFRS